MKIESINDLTPDPRNANKGSERGQGVIEKSLRRLGAGRSILADKHGVIIAGNKTLEAAASIGIDRVRVIETDGTELVIVQRKDLDMSEPMAKELAIADNRASELSLDWDAEVLQQMAAEDVDLGAVGFSEKELEELNIAPIDGDWPDYDETDSHSIVLRYKPEDEATLREFIGGESLTDGRAGRKILERIKAIVAAGSDQQPGGSEVSG